MFISAILIILIASGGLALTYLFAEDEPILWRLSAGSIVGSAVFGLIAFVLACLVGFSSLTILISLAITILPLLLFRRPDTKASFIRDWAKAKGRLEGATLKKLLRFCYYAFFFILFWFFFDRAMYEPGDGIYTGVSQNLGDLPFHLGAIFGFTDGNNFPPQNPSWAGAKFSYPFIADLLTACFVKVGADVKNAMFVLNLTWVFSLLVLLERFVTRLTNNKLAGRLAPALLFFTGGLGFMWFFKDLWESGKGFLDFIWHLPRDYSIGDQFRWGNSMVVLFITQRSLLLGMPLTVIVLGYLWKVFNAETAQDAERSQKSLLLLSSFSPFLIGLLAGMLPLIHLHSLAVLFVVTAFLFVSHPAKWREWIAFGVGVALVAVPELVWSMSGSATETAKFFAWHFGWDKRQDDVFWFWLKNSGLTIPILLVGIGIYLTQRRKDAENTKVYDQRSKINGLLLFYIPFIFLFLVSNAAKLAPWEWDNIKILIYWFVGSIPFIALALAFVWQRNNALKVAAASCFMVLILSGALDVWRTASGQVKMRVFDTDAIRIAEQIKQKTEPNALFLNAPTYNSAVVLSGRQSLMRYSGHLSSHGIDYGPREADVRRIYEGGGVSDILLKKYNIEYVMVSGEERNTLKANEEFFKKHPVAAEAGQYRVYKVK